MTYKHYYIFAEFYFCSELYLLNKLSSSTKEEFVTEIEDPLNNFNKLQVLSLNNKSNYNSFEELYFSKLNLNLVISNQQMNHYSKFRYLQKNFILIIVMIH